MNDSMCPVCGKPNSDKVEICQYCGAALNNSDTVPLPPIRPGDMPEVKKTSELERTLPGWLRDVRKASKKDDNLPEPENPAPVKPPVAPSPVPQGPRKPDFGSPSDLLAGLSHLDDDEEETPDWLKSLQSGPPAAPLDAEPAPTPKQQSIHDLFSGSDQPPEKPDLAKDKSDPSEKPGMFQPDENTGPESQAASDPSIYADLPDWLAALTGETSQPVSTQPGSRSSEPQPTASDDTDWLSSLGGDFASDDSASTVEPTAPANAETPDWLSRMGDDEPAAAAGYIPAPPQPEWLPGLHDPDQTPTNAGPSGDISDWLSSLDAASTPAAPASTPEVTNAAPSDDISAWLSSLDAASTPAAPVSTPEVTNAAPSGDISDWLSSLDAASTPTVPDSTPETTSAVPPSDIPDWLSSLQGSAPTPAAPDSTPEATNAGLSADVPDWLSSLQASAPTPAAPASTPETTSAASAGDVPDWLSSLQASAPTPTMPASTPETTSATPPGDIPDWLSGPKASTQVPAGTPEVPQVSGTSSSDGMPDWMVEAINAKPDEASTPLLNPFDTSSMAELAALDTGSEVPDWIAGLGKTPQAENKPAQELTSIPASSSTPDVSGSNPASIDEDTSDWLNAFAEETKTDAQQKTAQGQAETASTPASQSEVGSLIPATAAETENIDSILSMDAPDWLSGFAPASADQVTLPVDESSPDLRPGELPSWVQAMRPMESVMAGTSDNADEQEIENQGPLAGLRSVLPTQSGLVEAHTPKVYSTNLFANETQQAQAALLENLLNSENIPQVFSKRSETTNIRPLRWLIAAVLFLAILIVSSLGTEIFPAPLMPAESSPIGRFIKTVTYLSDEAPVLVVMDYQPGFAGELESAAGPVMEQLMSKKMRLAFVSTSPMGGLMAERLLQKFAGSYPYLAGSQYVNLGYLPGGASSIKAFADQPAAILGRDTLLGNLWDSAALKDVTVNSSIRLSNFAALIVVTDDPDTGRLWIEQAQPALGSKPMLMVVSAQAEPMLRPYFISKQLNGLSSGLEGGMLYESAQGKPGQARTYWDAFGVAMLATEVLILIGGVWSLVSGLLARRAAMEQDEA